MGRSSKERETESWWMSLKGSETMTSDERLAVLEKEVAELREQALVQPEEIAENLASRLQNVYTKMTDRK